jgi:D-alanine--poly(phosphoribitol) ligase subunit 1
MKTIWDLVARQAAQAPAATAVRGEPSLSYAQLLGRAAALAAELAPGARPGSLLALAAATPGAAAVAMLAAARAGCAVLPLSADSPARHRDLILADARPALWLTELGGDDYRLAVSRPDATSPPPRRDLPGVAYVLYTSGSTGVPKGVVIPHEALLARLAGLAERPGFGRDDSVLAVTALSFDISMAEILLPLSVGGQFVSAPPEARLDPAAFARLVSMYSPTVLQATPSFWQLMLAWGWPGAPGARIWCGGEPLTASLGARLRPSGRQLWNLYGPTEATIWASASQVTAPDRISLGEPVPGTGMFLAGEDGEPITAPGRPGEILLYGAGLARGYLERPELTAERFCLRPTPDGPARCYRTGDRGQFGESGQLEFLGRDDGQVKLRGHRIELGEIESVLEQHPAISQAVVVLREPDVPERAHIAAFVVAGDGLTPREIRRWLADRLPAPARPGHIEVVPGIPRTTAGKADRVQLAAGPVTRTNVRTG